MILLNDVRDYIASLNVAADEDVYSGIMPTKPDKAIGVYPLKRAHELFIPLGGINLKSYEDKAISILIHWNKSPKESEIAAYELFNHLINVTDNEQDIKFIKLLCEEPIFVGHDDAGINEYVIECLVFKDKEI